MASVPIPVPGGGVDDRAIVDARPRVRALVLARLEMIWSTVEPHVGPEAVLSVERLDPRWAELGLRVLDRLERLYRLGEAERVEAVETSGDQATLRASVLAELAEIESRLSAR